MVTKDDTQNTIAIEKRNEMGFLNNFYLFNTTD